MGSAGDEGSRKNKPSSHVSSIGRDFEPVVTKQTKEGRTRTRMRG
jgi:hypothetical protein